MDGRKGETAKKNDDIVRKEKETFTCLTHTQVPHETDAKCYTRNLYNDKELKKEDDDGEFNDLSLFLRTLLENR